jgi:hypothetical protein
MELCTSVVCRFGAMKPSGVVEYGWASDVEGFELRAS